MQPPKNPTSFRCGSVKTNKVYKMEAIELLKQLPDNSVDLVLTDPPYNMTACEWDKPIDLKELWKELKRVGKENCAFIFTASQPFTTDLINSNREMFKYELIWEKTRNSNPSLAKSRPLPHHENIIIFSPSKPNYNPQKEDGEKYKTRKGAGGRFAGNKVNKKDFPILEREGRFPKSILKIKSEYPNSLKHPTQKPLELFEWLIKSYSNENQLVLDCFGGSGTTAVASKKLNRNFICCDINEEYVKITESRLLETAPVGTLNHTDSTFLTEKAINKDYA